MKNTPLQFSKFLLSFLVFFGVNALAQTPEQANEITASYNKAYLQNIAAQSLGKSTIEKNEAIEYAKARNIPISYTTEEGAFVDLQRVLPDGTLIYYTTNNVDAARSTRTNHLNIGGSTGYDLEGQNMIAHVWDGGHPRVTHQEYHGPGGNNRVSIMDSPTQLNFHAAHVVGTIAASGVVPAAKGMAPRSTVKAYQWDFDLSEATTAVSTGMLLSNHSYGYRSDNLPDQWFGAYREDARDWDNLMFSAPYYLMVKAAGNDGSTTYYNAQPLQSGYDMMSGAATSKNNLVVANAQDAVVDNNGNLISVAISGTSSPGPTDDFRIKPDITGNGSGVYSTYETSNTAYNSISGTSMASPNVTGSLLLLQEHYNNINGSFMRAATLKGLALHTADDAGPVGPDARWGWGLMNAKRAAETITQNRSEALVQEMVLAQGQTITLQVDADGLNDLIASISWTDRAGVINTQLNSPTPALVNDLDIRVSKDGTTYYPWRLTSATTNSNNGDNRVDPFERIEVENASGTYTISISHKGNLVGGSQAFSLIVTGLQVDCIAATTPQNVNVNNVTDTAASVSWTPVPGASYDSRYREVGASSWIDVFDIQSVNYEITGLVPSTEYEVEVRSKCDAGSPSAYSAAINFTTLAELPADVIIREPDHTSGLISTKGNDGTGVYCADYFSLADDIILGELTFYGLNSNSGYIAPYVTGFNVYIYNVSGSTPDSNPELAGTGVIELADINPIAYTLTEDGAAASEFKINITQANGGIPLLLPAGEYWISAFPSVIGAPTGLGRWNWYGSLSSFPTEEPVLIDPSDLFGVGATNWSNVPGLIGEAFPSFAWSMTGTEPLTPLIITCAPDATRDTDLGVCEYTVVGTEFDASFTGVGTITNDFNGTSTLAGETLPIGTTSVVWTVTDGSGQSETCTATITVEDNEAPEITCIADATRETAVGSTEYTVVGSEFDATFTDNCSSASITNDFNGTSTLANEVLPVGVTAIVWTVDDGNGQTATCTTVVTVEENNPLVITCAPDATRDTDMGVCEYTVVGTELDATFTGAGTLTNNYNGTSTLAGETLPIGTTSVVWTVTDGSGQSETCTTTITVEDNEAPEITCIADATRETAVGSTEYTVVGSEFDATFTDNCSSASITNDFNETSTLANEVLPVGVTAIVWTVDDGNGQIATCTTVVTVEENNPLVITCAPDATRDTDLGVCEYTVVGTEFNATFTGAGTLTNNYNGTSTLAGETLPIGTTSVVWTVTDGSGQSETCTTTITVEDNEAPEITCIADATRETAVGSTEYTVVGSEFDATFTDNCSSASITNDFNGTSTLANEVLPVGVTAIVWTVDDGNGQTATCTTVVTVEENNPLVITCAPDATRDTDLGVCEYTVVGTEFNATFTGAGTLTNNYNGTSTLAGETLPIGATSVVWTVTDGSGQSETCTTTITVEDNEAPEITCIADATRETAVGSTEYTVVGSEFDATFTDNCSSASITNDFNGTSTLANEVLPVGVTAIVWTVDDGNGQTATCATVVTVEENNPLIISCAPDATRDTDLGVCEYTVVGTEFNATFTGAGTLTNNYNGTSTLAGETLPIGTTSVVWTVTDGSGQSETCTTTITVEDNEAPVISCPSDQIVEIEASDEYYTLPDYFATGEATATDNCTDPVTNTSQSPAPGTELSEGVHTITLNATDEYGNLSSCSFDITVNDTLGLNAVLNYGTISIYPVPTKDVLSISNPKNIELERLEIYDLSGRLVHTKDLRGLSGMMKVDVEHLPIATYYIDIIGKDGMITKRFVME